jgi:hypothetical protein
MNQIESLVSEINYLADSPGIAIPGVEMDGHQRQTSSAESPQHEHNGNGKRKSEDAGQNGTANTRAKRNRYISIAW